MSHYPETPVPPQAASQSSRGPARFTIDSVLQRNLPSRGAAPDRVAVVFREQSLTFEELDQRAKALAAGLLAHGFQHGDAICLLAHNRLEWFEVLFAAAKIGGVIVPVNYLLKPNEIASIVRDCRARWFLGEDILWDAVATVRQQVDPSITYLSLGARQDGAISYEQLCTTATTFPAATVHPDDLLLLQYTSGTTGTPKGTMHTHETVLWNSLHQIPDFKIDRDDVHLIIPAMCWAAGFHSFTLAVLWAGGKVIMNPSRAFDAAEFCRTVQLHQVTKTILVPSVLRRVLDYEQLEQHDLSSLDLVLSGGEPVPVEAIEQWHGRVPSCALVQGYGMGEFPTLMLYLTASDARRKAGAAGKPCLIAEVRVVDDSFRDTDVDEIGEIVVRSPACTLGYYGQPAATAATFDNGWMRTGDLARIDNEGFVYVAGRAKEMIISGGLNVYPAEVEQVLLDLDAVAEAAVVGVPDEHWGEVPEAFVMVRPGHDLTVAALEARCRADLANYKIPKRWTVRTEPLPRTTSGKIQRHLLASQARQALSSAQPSRKEVA